MSTDTRTVAEKIRSGTYYKEAMDWFHEHYVRPQTELSTMVIICLMALTALVVGFGGFKKIFPITPEVPMVIYRPLQVQDYLTLSHMGNKRAGNVNQAFARYYLQEYVKSREEYLERKLDRNFNFVATISSPEVFEEFSKETSLENPNNPKLVYGNKADIYAEVQRISLLDSVGNPVLPESNALSRALVTYSSIVVFDDGTQQATTYQADISFQYKEIIVDQKNNDVTQQPELIITSYKTKAL